MDDVIIADISPEAVTNARNNLDQARNAHLIAKNILQKNQNYQALTNLEKNGKVKKWTMKRDKYREWKKKAPMKIKQEWKLPNKEEQDEIMQLEENVEQTKQSVTERRIEYNAAVIDAKPNMCGEVKSTFMNGNPGQWIWHKNKVTEGMKSRVMYFIQEFKYCGKIYKAVIHIHGVPGKGYWQYDTRKGAEDKFEVFARSKEENIQINLSRIKQGKLSEAADKERTPLCFYKMDQTHHDHFKKQTEYYYGNRKEKDKNKNWNKWPAHHEYDNIYDNIYDDDLDVDGESQIGFYLGMIMHYIFSIEIKKKKIILYNLL